MYFRNLFFGQKLFWTRVWHRHNKKRWTKRWSIETWTSFGMARNALSLWFNQIENWVAIAIDPDVDHFHKVSAFLTFDPAFLSGGWIDADLTRSYGLIPTCTVSECDHEDFEGFVMLNDDESKVWNTIDLTIEGWFKNFHLPVTIAYLLPYGNSNKNSLLFCREFLFLFCEIYFTGSYRTVRVQQDQLGKFLRRSLLLERALLVLLYLNLMLGS